MRVGPVEFLIRRPGSAPVGRLSARSSAERSSAGILELESDPLDSNAAGKPVTLANAPAFPTFFSALTIRHSELHL
jgi:hypothetical protein